MIPEPSLAVASDVPVWQRLGELLVGAGKLSQRDLDRAIAAREELGGRLEAVLTQLGLVSEIDVAQARSSILGVRYSTGIDAIGGSARRER